MEGTPKLESKPIYPTEGALLVDDLLEQAGLSREEFTELPREERKQVMDQVREILQEPNVVEILKNRSEPGLGASDATAIREVLDVKKWNKLNELVSYVKTVIADRSPEERGNLYEKHLAFGVDANELKQTLSHIYDVFPARIETDIRHQSSLFYRAMVEVVSNALDASVKDKSPIGRFGIGFYQILNHLNDPSDRVVVTTKRADDPVGIRIEFRKKGEDIDFSISEDTSISEHGTQVELKTKEFEGEKGEAIIKEYFSHSQDISIILNGEVMDRWAPSDSTESEKELPTVEVKIENGHCVVIDKGIGMGAQTVFEKLLVPKLSDKPPVHELKEKGELKPKFYYETSSEIQQGNSKIVIQVGGIQVEKFEATGVNLAKTLVINLPASTILGEQRDQVEINEDVVKAMKNVIDEITSLPEENRYQVVNSIGKTVREFQKRSTLYRAEDSLTRYLQHKLNENSPNTFFIPNNGDFLNLNLEENVILLDSNILQSPVKSLPGFKEIENWKSGSGMLLLQAPFKEGNNESIIVTEDFIVIDSRLDISKNTDFINEAVRLAAGYNRGTVTEVTIEKEKLEKEKSKETNAETFGEYVDENWEQLYFPSLETAQRQAKSLEAKRPDITAAFNKEVFNGIRPPDIMPFWDLMQWYINSDKRDAEIQLKEIENLAQNISVLSGNEAINNVIQSYKIPLISSFEELNANLPIHIRSKLAEARREGNKIDVISVKGKEYYICNLRKEYHSYQMLLSLDGEATYFGGPEEGLLFKNNEVTVFYDRAINTKTGEELPSDFNFIDVVPWGSVFSSPIGEFIHSEIDGNAYGLATAYREGKIRSDKKYFFFASFDRRPDGYYEKHPPFPFTYYRRPYAEKISPITDEEGSTYKEFEGKLYVNDKPVEWPTLGDLQVKKIFKTETGEVVIAGGRKQEKYYGDDPNIETSILLDNKGNTIWSFKQQEWGDKVTSLDKKLDEEKLKKLREEAAQCILISPGSEILDDTPIIRIVSYYTDFNTGSDREATFRKNVGYITASGESIKIENNQAINGITLAAKYAWEGDSHASVRSMGWGNISPYTIRYDHPHAENTSYSGYKEISRTPVVSTHEEIPVKIIDEFKFDSGSNQWLALAEYKSNKYCLAIFDKYVGFEDLGDLYPWDKKALKGKVTRNLEFRDRRQYYINNRYPRNLEPNFDRQWERKGLATIEDDNNTTYLNDWQREYNNYKFFPKFQEADRNKDGILDTTISKLTPEHASILEDFLINYPAPNKLKLEKLFYRVLQFREVSPDDLKYFLPVFYDNDWPFNEDLLNENCLKEIRDMYFLEEERFTQLIKLAGSVLPEDKEKQQETLLKVINFYSERLQGESTDSTKRLIYELASPVEFDDTSISSVANLLKYKVDKPISDIPKPVRAFYIYLHKSEKELISDIHAPSINMPETPPDSITLSELIQWKRLQESKARTFSGDTHELTGEITKINEGKNRYHINREITHAIHFQALNATDLYIRELVQNAVDVLQQEDVDLENRKLEVAVTSKDKTEVTTHFSDPVGMSLQTFVNYFLTPGETTKLDKKYIGYYGQGVYTLFKNSKEVLVKTGLGDGVTHYITMTPILEHDMVSDVKIDFRTSDESFKGTTISKTQNVKNPYVEAAYVRDAMATLTSGLSDQRAQILFQGEKTNTTYREISNNKSTKFGEVTIFKNQNNIVTHHGLYVRDAQEYLGLLPDFMSRSLLSWGGVAIDLPKGIELTRSRQDIASKDKIGKELNPAIQQALVSGYLNQFREKMDSDERVFPYEKLPYDYFYESGHYSIPSSYHEDARNLVEGKPLQHIEEYADESNAIKFLTLLPVLKIEDKSLSVDDLRKAFPEQEFPFTLNDWPDHLPRKLVKMLSEQKEVFDKKKESEKKDEELNIPDDNLEVVIENAPKEIKKWIMDNLKELKTLDQATDVFLKIIDPIFSRPRPTEHGFYYKHDYSMAHASKGWGWISWNLRYLQENDRSPMGQVEEENRRYGGKENKKLKKIIYILAHEYGHILEGLGQWTHDPAHDKSQAKVLIQFLINKGIEAIDKSLAE